MVLRGLVWLVSVLGKEFCQVGLGQVFRKGECVDVDGRGMGEAAELLVGGCSCSRLESRVVLTMR